MGLFKKNIFGQYLILKKWIIRIIGTLSHRRYRGFNELQIEGSDILRNLPDTNVLFISNHQTYFADVVAMFHVFNAALSGRDDNIKNVSYLWNPKLNIYYVAAKETMKTKPINYYALTKLKCELIIKKYSKKYDFNYAILRYFNVCGASPVGKIGITNKKNNSFFKILAKQALKKVAVINIFGNKHKTKDGTCLRDFIHVSDLAAIHLKALEVLNKKKNSFLINCGYGKGTSVLEIANLFKKNINKFTKINFKKARKGEISISYSNTDKMKKILKWRPKYNNINLILKNAINWEKKIL